jgi:hypothetical protein
LILFKAFQKLQRRNAPAKPVFIIENQFYHWNEGGRDWLLTSGRDRPTIGVHVMPRCLVSMLEYVVTDRVGADSAWCTIRTGDSSRITRETPQFFGTESKSEQHSVICARSSDAAAEARRFLHPS